LYGKEIELLDVVEKRLPTIPFRAQAGARRKKKI